MVRAQACRSLVSQRRWCLSGTPVSTQVADLKGQLAALRFDFAVDNFSRLFDEPFREVGAPGARGGERALRPSDRSRATSEGQITWPGSGAMRLLLPEMMIRHTKSMVVGGERVLALPKKTERRIEITLSPRERHVYAAAERMVRREWRKVAEQGHGWASAEYLYLMSLLQPLRRLCSGGLVTRRELTVINRHRGGERISVPLAADGAPAADKEAAPPPPSGKCVCCGVLEAEKPVQCYYCSAISCCECYALRCNGSLRCMACRQKLCPEMAPDDADEAHWEAAGAGGGDDEEAGGSDGEASGGAGGAVSAIASVVGEGSGSADSFLMESKFKARELPPPPPPLAFPPHALPPPCASPLAPGQLNPS